MHDAQIVWFVACSVIHRDLMRLNIVNNQGFQLGKIINGYIQFIVMSSGGKAGKEKIIRRACTQTATQAKL